MGNSTGSMFYLFVIVVVLYIVGASIYQVFLWFRKWQEKKRDEKFNIDMADIIVVLIVIVLLGFALRGAIKHFKGDSPCCGGGTGIIKTDDKELKNPVIGKKTVHIEGMSCDHCVQSVKKALNEIEGASARVDLQKKEAVVSYDREIANDVLKKAIEKAGFQVVSITE